ncbi:hypothetical protein ACI7YT_12550 [Microbacterium sp. M]|uniref:hypothetical protein n=1 Tax=Microbacterium sp. M TaxID=3377125 RepID=UPI00386BAEB9
MSNEFRLTITLGNDAMQTGNDIADALSESSAQLAGRYGVDYLDEWTGLGAGIFDANGNRVGRWGIERGSDRRSPEQIAQSVLDAHAIRPDWKRSGEQIAGLLAEAVRAARGEA